MKGIAIIAGFLALEGAFLFHAALPGGTGPAAAAQGQSARRAAPEPAPTVRALPAADTAPAPQATVEEVCACPVLG